ncbi:uncharacterized protein [Setaria viridis]|uniref:uncharacterized protein n=1 Tax=Setaria viridis TaxID=4556 RepID=UPI003B3A05F5
MSDNTADAAYCALVARVAAFTPEERREAARQEAERLETARLEAERLAAERLEEERRANEARAVVLADQAAAATATLHAQAMTILNIKSLVPLILELASPSFNRWRGLFMNTLKRFELDDHVLSDDNHSDDAVWLRMDCTVLSWLHGVIAPDLLEIVMNREDGPPTARLVWLGVEQQFLGNKESRALILDAEFRTFMQGDLGVDEYCHRMKAMADRLGDLGEPVRDSTLVLNILRGLNERFGYMAALIQRTHPFPTYRDVRSDLRLVEMNMKDKAAAPAQAFAATTPRSSTSAAPTPQHPFNSNNTGAGVGGNTGNGNRGRQNRRGGRNSRGTGSQVGSQVGSPAGPGTPPRPFHGPPCFGYQPAFGTFQAYVTGPPGFPRFPAAPPRPQAFFVGPQYSGPSLPGPAPPLAPLPLPPTAVGLPPAPPAQPATWMHHPSGLSWNNDALASAFNTMTLQPPPQSTECVSGYKYYLIILDDCSHYFGTTIQSIQCDNGREFDNSAARTLVFLRLTGLRLFTPPHISSTVTPPRP